MNNCVKTIRVPNGKDARFRGEYADLATLTAGVTTPNAGDTAVIIDATALGYPSESVNVFWNGSSWVAVGRELNTTPNQATQVNDPSRAQIANVSPAQSNTLGLREFRSSDSVTVRSNNGVLQFAVAPNGARLNGTGGANSIPFATLTLATASNVSFNTTGASTTLTPMTATISAGARYMWRGGFETGSITQTATSNGVMTVRPTVNGVTTIGLASKQSMSIDAGFVLQLSTSGASVGVQSVRVLSNPVGTLIGTAVYQSVVATFANPDVSLTLTREHL